MLQFAVQISALIYHINLTTIATDMGQVTILNRIHAWYVIEQIKYVELNENRSNLAKRGFDYYFRIVRLTVCCIPFYQTAIRYGNATVCVSFNAFQTMLNKCCSRSRFRITVMLICEVLAQHLHFSSERSIFCFICGLLSRSEIEINAVSLILFDTGKYT